MKKSNPERLSLKGVSAIKEKPVTPDLNKTASPGGGSMKRRKFLGMGLFGMAGLSVPLASMGGEDSSKKVPKLSQGLPHRSRQTDSFEEKIKLLQDAWSRKDYRLARALTNSLRISQIQAQAEEENFGTPLIPANRFGRVAELPAAWSTWARGWNYYKALELEEKAGISRKAAPVEVLLSFPGNQVQSLAREIRVAELYQGQIRELVSQVFSEIRRGGETQCKLMFLADNLGKEKRTYLVFYGNPDAELPNYQSDLKVTGEGYGLDIENEYFTAQLSKQTGQLARMILKREHGLEIYSGGQGHGEPAGIDWAHDYVTEEGFQKLRISLWDECPDFEVVRGPICTIIRRWGFPYSPVHPLFSPARMNMDIEYRFYAGLPYFHKFGHMTAVQQFEPAALRDDEWVITGQSFTDMMWMGPDGKVRLGEVPEAFKNQLWGIGFYNKDTRDSFVGLFLEHHAEGLPELVHNGSPQLYYKWHGQIWARYPLQGITTVPAGTVLHQKNAYATIPFAEGEGQEKIERLRQELLHPMVAVEAALPRGMKAGADTSPLARVGEAGDSPIHKKLLWEALHRCKDPQLYKSDISVVDLGLIYDISVRRGLVKVVMAMPHRGRPLGTYFTYGSNVVHSTESKTILEALYEVPGVRKVIMEQTWYPEWNVNRLTEEGRRKLGLQ